MVATGGGIEHLTNPPAGFFFNLTKRLPTIGKNDRTRVIASGFSRNLNHSENYCWRAIARQHTILYNRAKSAKSVGCKIGDMRSRLRFLYLGIPECL